ncbi:MAG: acetyltransferase [Gammaproteobacteria bacterium]|nr:acetyltransferase [Gammaproteobacteria bacterium]
MSRETDRRLAERVRSACIEAALAGYENASISGLCHEGAWEAAISAIRMADLDEVLTSRPNAPDQP